MPRHIVIKLTKIKDKKHKNATMENQQITYKGSLIILNVSTFNLPNKRQRLDEWIHEQVSISNLGTNRDWKWEDGIWYSTQMEIKRERESIKILILEKIEFKIDFYKGKIKILHSDQGVNPRRR